MTFLAGVQRRDRQIPLRHPFEGEADHLRADPFAPIFFSGADTAEKAGGDGHAAHPETPVAHAHLTDHPAIHLGDQQVIGIVPGLLLVERQRFRIVGNVLGKRFSNDPLDGRIVAGLQRPAERFHHSSSSEKITSSSRGKIGLTQR